MNMKDEEAFGVKIIYAEDSHLFYSSIYFLTEE